MSEALLALCRAARAYDASQMVTFATYACSAIERELYKWWAKKECKHHNDRLQADPLTSDNHGHLEAVQFLEEALASISELRREAIERVLLDGQTVSQAAEDMGKSKQAVSDLIRQGIAAIRTLYPGGV